MLCAYFLDQAGIDYLLCEAATIASGTTGKTTAVLSAQHDTLYSDLISRWGHEKAQQYLDANLDALKEYRSLAEKIDCDYEERPSYMYTVDKPRLMEHEVEALQSLGFSASVVKELPLPIKIAAAVKFPGQAQFHPLKFIGGICNNLNIREHSRIVRMKGTDAFTEKYRISAKRIIVASHFPILNTHGFYYAKLYQKRSYIIALENAPQYDGTFVDNGTSGMYFRNYGNLLLVGGDEHRTGKKGGNFEALRTFIRANYPGAKEKYAWATQDCMSLDGVPYIGKYSELLPDVYVATGFNEWGMTSSMVAAKILCDMIMKRENKYADVFNPSRSVLTPQLFANLGESILNLLKPVPKRCPHLGCALSWNEVEQTWDCPCHGSRFTKDGKLINDPATGDLREK
ncbi:FAD-dependent oxidoreductase [Thermocaproicibacter melissae]|uniref:FAD-dependent oxidoreductase n=1 Tax=Thermocaproicibacter melissae TaxID=2966552 RepID=UPI003A103842